MTALLDVNVLIALGWRNHVHHVAAREWFTRCSSKGWATTPVTEIGFVRISSNRRLMQVSTTPSTAIAQLEALRRLPGHEFWPDDVPLVVGEDGDRGVVSTHRLVTDRHLIALAARYGGRLVTFDAALADSASAGVIEVL
ncbi:putative ribonuclease VapC39 [Mycobacterium kansasii 732]|uniref:Ribonuclease VapC n=1 Tax=Mycobacterium pseudokansasii TaxID=2341080 RepID=A0A498QQ44_9MYCO|nr:type II toxin-antitoxin system VapC family toxin [Mycobacterium pseudokansasii]EUA12113.1 putative ribonuclease VapC39 [Mycobacterium kansasii 732]KZS60248.1 ribonuclease [Mycobacterium kansasii]MBY0388595.1 type II toxin-antitoxin system VapC family toxin [Mycobacterium pseudokansasii]VAZ94014.1 Ribonuclease VapC39 [Mycobacterium pseudokansasii]VAZ95002.1 Ribonuclease VapC39 [Mycobacterium pseudokansasii]